MKIEIAKYERMAERGSSLLRLIQNNNMPLLDLFVRESVQNSLDASLPGNGYVNVDFITSKFKTSLLNHEFEGIESGLNCRFQERYSNLLAVRDSNTSGLTGPLHYSFVHDENYGNLLKLIYEISMPQQMEGAGGSWGLGKTIYFRIGIGLVIYYSKVKTDEGIYQSRLAACLVEDENSARALIQYGEEERKRGIAWWGVEDGNNRTIPLTDEVEINRILTILELKPYSFNETGTMIIIPYIDEDRLLEGILPTTGHEDKIDFSNLPWLENIEEYLKVALQRWYSPRLMNPDYPYGRWLRSKINNKGIIKEEMEQSFQIIQQMYNKIFEKDFINANESMTINVKDINLRRVFSNNSLAGHIAFGKFNRNDLKMSPPDNNKSPFYFVNIFEKSENNTPMVLFVRKPGMIVGYETIGKWTDSIPKTSNDEFIIGIFVLESDNVLNDNAKNISLEEYVRKCEKADHTSWNDWNINGYKPNVISRIQQQVSSKIAKNFTNNITNESIGRNKGLSRALASALLPPERFGNKALSGTLVAINRGIGSRIKGYGFNITSGLRFKENYIEMDFEMVCGKNHDVFLIELNVKSESGLIHADKWEDEKDIGTAFPIRIIETRISKVKTGKKMPPYKFDKLVLNDHKILIKEKGISFEIIKTKRYYTPYAIKVKVPECTGYSINGTIRYHSNDLGLQAGINMIDVGGAKK